MNYFLVFLLIGVLQSLSASPLSNGVCTKHCKCVVEDNEELISCKKGDSRLTVRVSETTYDYGVFINIGKRGNKLTINCTTFDQFAYEVAPQLNVTNLIGLEFNNCPLPADGSISLGFPDLYELLFTTEEASDYGTLSNQHLDGLGSLNTLRMITKTTTFHLTDDTFTGLPRLARLYFHSKEINFKAFSSLTNIRKLEIGALNGEFNLDGLKNLENLEQVNLANLQITRLSKRIFENLPALIDTLMFYENNIGTIDPDVFTANGKLSFLRFSDNVIQHFPSHFDGDNIEYFQLFGNHESIPDEMLSNLPKLRDVDIHCNLKSVPENLFKGSYNMNILNLTGNQLTDLPENLLANQTKLFHLYLNQNRFENVLPENLIKNLMTKPKWVSSVLFVFSFKSNRIQSISEDDWKLLLEKNAEYNFADNLFADFSVFDKFGKTFTNSDSFFIFNDNPIDCDCGKIKPLRTYLKNEDNVWRFSYENNEAKCASPANLKGTLVADVQCDG